MHTIKCVLLCGMFWRNTEYKKCFPSTDSVLRSSELYESVYKNQHFGLVKLSKTPRIPKIIHHIWVGGTLSPIFRKYIAFWKQHHPGWEHQAGHAGAMVYLPSYCYPFLINRRFRFWCRWDRKSIVYAYIKPETLAVYLWAASRAPATPASE